MTANAIAPAARTRMTEAIFTDMKAAGSRGFDENAPENISPLVVWLGSSESKDDHRPCLRSEGRHHRYVSDGWRDGPTIDKGARWEPDEVGAAVHELMEKSPVPQKCFGT